MKYYLLLLLLILYYLIHSMHSSCTLNNNQPYPPQVEIVALIDFYNSTNGDYWSSPYNCGWTSDINNITYNPCSWYGITCTSGHISKIIFNVTSNIMGTLPSSFCNLAYVEDIVIQSNQIYGSIPDCWPNSSIINEVLIDGGCITGSYPLTLALSGTLQYFLVTGLLSSAFPVSWSNLNMIEYIILKCTMTPPSEYVSTSNIQTSLIPDSWSSWTNLEVFFVEYLTFYTGTIPTYFESFQKLQQFGLFCINFVGPIPNKILCLPNLTNLDLVSNLGTNDGALNSIYMNSSFPLSNNFFTTCTGLRNLPLEYIFMQTSGVAGAIASDFGLTFPGLKVFNAYINALSSTIPSSICQMFSLIQLQLNNNFLTGTVDPCFVNMAKLEYFSFAQNLLTGTLPLVESCGNLVVLSLDSNRLKGNFATAFNSYSRCRFLENLLLSENLLTGYFDTVTLKQGSFLSLQGLVVFSNSIQGSIPSTLGYLKNLISIMMASNDLTGTIPQELLSCSSLFQLDLSDNYLSGPLVIPSTVTVLGLAQNYLTGTIPSSLFSSGLFAASISSNCLVPSIPETVCNSSSLYSLNVDGLRSSCKTEVLSGQKFEFPSCVWSLPSLQNLSFAGNSYYGLIPNVSAASELTVVQANYNNIEGDINTLLRLPKIQTLQFSNNIATNGEMLYLAKPIETLDITMNRLSGTVLLNSSIVDTTGMSILVGNIFSCSGLQRFDTSTYSCGNEALTVSLLSFLLPVGILVLVAVTVAFEYYHEKGVYPLDDLFRHFVDVILDQHPSTDLFIRRMVKNERYKCQMIVTLLLYTLVVLVPLYSSNKSRGFLHLFSWSATSVYMSPGSMTVTIYCFCCTALGLFYFWFLVVWCEVKFDRSSTSRLLSAVSLFYSKSEGEGKFKVTSLVNSLLSLGVLLFAAVLLLVPSFVVNVAYVYSTNQTTLSNKLKQLLEFIVSLLKSLINYVYVPYLHNWLFSHLLRNSKYSIRSLHHYAIVSTQIFNLLGGIVMPLVAVSLFQDQCFKYALFSPQQIVSIATSAYCSIITIEWLGSCGGAQGTTNEWFGLYTVESSYSPPFQYSFVCASTLVTIYVPLFTVSVNISCASSLVFCLLSTVRRSSLYYRYHSIEVIFKKISYIMPNSMLYASDFAVSDSRLISDSVTQIRNFYSNFSTYTVLALSLGIYAAQLQTAIALCLLAEFASIAMLISHICSVDSQRKETQSSQEEVSGNPINRVEDICSRITVVGDQSLLCLLQNELKVKVANERVSSILSTTTVTIIPLIFMAVLMIDTYKGQYLFFWCFPWPLAITLICFLFYHPKLESLSDTKDSKNSIVEMTTL